MFSVLVLASSIPKISGVEDFVYALFRLELYFGKAGKRHLYLRARRRERIQSPPSPLLHAYNTLSAHPIFLKRFATHPMPSSLLRLQKVQLKPIFCDQRPE
jgi:hypothetical protein